MQKKIYNVGGIQVLLKSDDICNWAPFPQLDTFVDHSIEPKSLLVNLNVHCDSIPNIDYGEQIFDNGVDWRLYRKAGQWIICNDLQHSGVYRLGIFSDDFLEGEIYIRPNLPYRTYLQHPLEHPMGIIYFINLLAQGWGSLIHSCGVVYDQKGFLFIGRGGSGKSTTSRFWDGRPGVKVLSDDRIIVREQEDLPWIYGTPWPGTGGIYAQGEAPLRGMFFLRQAPQHELKPLHGMEVFSRLMMASFTPLWSVSGMDFTLKLFGQLASQIPCFELGFARDQSVVDFILSQSYLFDGQQ